MPCRAIGQALDQLHLKNLGDKEGRKKTMSFGLRKEDHMDSMDNFREYSHGKEHDMRHLHLGFKNMLNYVVLLGLLGMVLWAMPVGAAPLRLRSP
jgi:hypothetical protein